MLWCEIFMSNCQSTLKYMQYCATGKLQCKDVQWWWKIAVQRLQTLRKKQPRRTITKADVEAENLTLLLRKVSIAAFAEIISLPQVAFLV